MILDVSTILLIGIDRELQNYIIEIFYDHIVSRDATMWWDYKRTY